MKKRRIFVKKSKKYYKYIIFLLIFSLIILFLLFFRNDKFFIITNFNKDFFIIPEDKKSKIIPYTNKRSLDKNINKKSETNEIDYNYSIQIYASTDYNLVLTKYNNTIKNPLILKNELFIVAFSNSLGIDYLLVYKNFNNNIQAMDYCQKHLIFIQNCLIVNIQNLE